MTTKWMLGVDVVDVGLHSRAIEVVSEEEELDDIDGTSAQGFPVGQRSENWALRYHAMRRTSFKDRYAEDQEEKDLNIHFDWPFSITSTSLSISVSLSLSSNLSIKLSVYLIMTETNRNPNIFLLGEFKIVHFARGE